MGKSKARQILRGNTIRSLLTAQRPADVVNFDIRPNDVRRSCLSAESKSSLPCAYVRSI